jgi:hypothetical protein
MTLGTFNLCAAADAVPLAFASCVNVYLASHGVWHRERHRRIGALVRGGDSLYLSANDGQQPRSSSIFGITGRDGIRKCAQLKWSLHRLNVCQEMSEYVVCHDRAW